MASSGSLTQLGERDGQNSFDDFVLFHAAFDLNAINYVFPILQLLSKLPEPCGDRGRYLRAPVYIVMRHTSGLLRQRHVVVDAHFAHRPALSSSFGMRS